jgi:hypothetical protein
MSSGLVVDLLTVSISFGLVAEQRLYPPVEHVSGNLGEVDSNPKEHLYGTNRLWEV